MNCRIIVFALIPCISISLLWTAPQQNTIAYYNYFDNKDFLQQCPDIAHLEATVRHQLKLTAFLIESLSTHEISSDSIVSKYPPIISASVDDYVDRYKSKDPFRVQALSHITKKLLFFEHIKFKHISSQAILNILIADSVRLVQDCLHDIQGKASFKKIYDHTTDYNEYINDILQAANDNNEKLNGILSVFSHENGLIKRAISFRLRHLNKKIYHHTLQTFPCQACRLAIAPKISLKSIERKLKLYSEVTLVDDSDLY